MATYTATTTPTKILDKGVASGVAIRKSVILYNNDASITVWVEHTSAACTQAAGFPIPPQTAFVEDKAPNQEFWIRSDSGSVNVRGIVEKEIA